MTLKTKAAVSYLTPILLAYIGAVIFLATGKTPSISEMISAAFPATGLLIVSHLFQDVLGKPIKEALVFYRLHSRLPGHRAFTQVCTTDTRIPSAYLQSRIEAVGVEAEPQQAEWYRLYLTVSEKASVQHASFRYLAWRDATATLTFLALLTPLMVIFGVLTWHQAAMLTVGCLAISLIMAAAARNSAYSLVRNVIAICASQ